MEAGRHGWVVNEEGDEYTHTDAEVHKIIARTRKKAIANTRELYTDELVRLTKEAESLDKEANSLAKYKRKYFRIKGEFEGIKQEFETGIRSWEGEDKSKSFVIREIKGILKKIKRILRAEPTECEYEPRRQHGGRKPMKRRKTKRRIKKS